MDTGKIKVKKINKQGRGHSIYLSKKDLEHLGVSVFDSVIIDRYIPGILKIKSIPTWRGEPNKLDEHVRK